MWWKGVGLKKLTAREQGVLRHVTEGHADKEIAHRLGISARTVQKHLQRVYAKLGVKNRTAAALLVVNEKAERGRESVSI